MLTVEQRLQKASIAIMAHRRYMALSGVLLIGKRAVVDSIPTACTNGRDEYYGRAFVERLNDPELRFLMLHEIYHKLYKHVTNLHHLSEKDADCANRAMDYVINTQLVDENRDDGFATMTGALKCGCYDTKYRGWDSVSVFRDLYDQKQAGGSGGQGEGDGQPLDDHDWENAKTMGEEEKRQLARDIDEAVRQGALAASKMGSGGDRHIEDLLKPQKDWREVLREFVSATCSGHDYSTWRRPNRRYIGTGYYMPSGVSETIGEIAIANDMSGSIGNREVQRMLSEVASIAETVKPEAVRILYWDTRVCADEKYLQHELDTMMQSTKPAGGGGTSVECVPEYMAAEQIKPQCAIVFTDGHIYGGWGSWTCPVLWVIVDNPSCRPPMGTTVHVTTRQL